MIESNAPAEAGARSSAIDPHDYISFQYEIPFGLADSSEDRAELDDPLSGSACEEDGKIG